MSLINETITNLNSNNKKPKNIKMQRRRQLALIIIGGLSLILLFGTSLFLNSISTKININFFSQVSSDPQKQKLIHLPYDSQVEYYNALNLLNEGKTDEASDILKSLMEKYPDFTLGKSLYNGFIS